MNIKIVTFLILIFLLVLTSSPVYSQDAAGGETKGSTQIVLLGTGTPNAEPDRSGTSIAIVVDGTPYIFDAGPGLIRRANAAFEAGVGGLKVSGIKRAFITHLHSDHTVGLPDLIFTPWVLDREEPLDVYGPPGIMNMIDHILAAYEEDIAMRIYGDQPSNTEGYKVNVFEIQPGVIYKDKKITVKAFLVNHGSWDYAYGYRIETPDRVIVISGDTAPTEELIKNAEGCDVLIHEVYSEAGFQNRTPEWQTYHSGSHTSTIQLADIAKRINPELVILYHQLSMGATPEEMLAEIADIYKGKVVYGNDLEIY